MKTVKQGGRVLQVEDEIVPRYLAQGYSVIDADGNVLVKGDIVTLDQARTEIIRLKAVEQALTEENAKLAARIAELEAAAPEGDKDSGKENEAPTE